MRLVRPGPERETAIQRMRERWAADEAALMRAPFPIVGLAAPFPNPVALGSFEAVNGQVASVGLRYGASGSARAPLVTVSTAAASSDREPPSVADVLRDLLSEQEDAEQPPLPGHAQPEAAEVLVDAVRQPMRILDNGRAWAAVVEPLIDDVALLVTVAARGWPLSGLALTRVDDLEPFLTGRRERIEAALARAGSRPRPEDWDLPVPDGLAGHQSLATAMIAMTQQSMATGGVLRAAPLGSGYAQRWEVATRAQMNLAGQRREEAEDAVHSMVNHLCQLAQSASWFSNSELADKAVAETLDYFAYGREVPSAEAQRAWSRYWGLHGQEPPAFASLSSAKETWLAAWRRWVEHR
jgi:hypothetical protein